MLNFLSHVPSVGTSTAAFVLLSKLVKYTTNNKLLVDTSRRQLWVWRNTVCSLVHASATSVWTVLCYYYKPEYFSDMIDAYSPLAIGMLAFSLGYIIYDFWDIIIHDKGRQWEVLIHHIAVTFAFTVALSTHKYLGFGVCSLLMEINSIFLHLRRLMKMLGLQKSKWYVINGLVVLVTLVCFRLLTSTWMVKWLLSNKYRLPALPFTVGLVGMFVILPTNIGLLWRLWSTDIARGNKLTSAKLVVD